jgi:hypothetical protein
LVTFIFRQLEREVQWDVYEYPGMGYCTKLIALASAPALIEYLSNTAQPVTRSCICQARNPISVAAPEAPTSILPRTLC